MNRRNAMTAVFAGAATAATVGIASAADKEIRDFHRPLA